MRAHLCALPANTWGFNANTSDPCGGAIMMLEGNTRKTSRASLSARSWRRRRPTLSKPQSARLQACLTQCQHQQPTQIPWTARDLLLLTLTTLVVSISTAHLTGLSLPFTTLSCTQTMHSMAALRMKLMSRPSDKCSSMTCPRSESLTLPHLARTKLLHLPALFCRLVNLRTDGPSIFDESHYPKRH